YRITGYYLPHVGFQATIFHHYYTMVSRGYSSECDKTHYVICMNPIIKLILPYILGYFQGDHRIVTHNMAFNQQLLIKNLSSNILKFIFINHHEYNHSL